jgi:hypothetical protein
MSFYEGCFILVSNLVDRINSFAINVIKDGQRFDPSLVVKQDTGKDTSGATTVSG